MSPIATTPAAQSACASFSLAGHERATIEIGASIGIGIFPRDGDDMDALLKAADTAMYKAKQSGNSLGFCIA